MIDFEERRDELLEEIEEMTRRKQYKALRDILVELEPADIADLFDDLPEEMLPLLFRLLPKELAAEVFVELDSDEQEMLIQSFSNTELKEVLDELVKKGELTVEQGKVLNQELKHNIKESVKKNVNVTLKPSNPDELKDVLNKMTPDQLAALKEQISQMQAKDVDAEGAKEEPEEAKEAEAEEAPAEDPEEN